MSEYRLELLIRRVIHAQMVDIRTPTLERTAHEIVEAIKKQGRFEPEIIQALRAP